MTCTNTPGDGNAGAAVPTPLAELEDRICSMAGHLTAGTCRWLDLLAEFDRRDGWAGLGMRSFPQWLSWRCGVGDVAAREYTRVAHALTGLPLIKDAFAAGRLSYFKVRALTRIAATHTEADLVMIGEHSTAAQIERIARGYRQARNNEANAERHDARSLSWRTDDDGSEVLTVRLTPEQAALARAALAAAHAAVTAEAHGHGAPTPEEATAEGADRPPYGKPTWMRQEEAKRAGADAFMVLAETVLATGPAPAEADDRTTVVVHADLNVLQNPPATRSPGEIAAAGHLDGGVALHPDTIRRLGCDAALIAMIHGTGGTVLDVGRKTRVISAAMRRALRHRDRTCRFPGCAQTRWTDAHHIIHWLHGGPTDLANLILLCRHHHRVVHEGGYTITQTRPGEFTFTRGDGTAIPHDPQPTPCKDPRPADLHTATITPDTIAGHWAGEPLDLGYVVAGLVQKEDRLRRQAS